MKTRDVVLVTILSCGAAAVLLAAGAYLYIRGRRRKRESDEDGTSCAIRTDTSSDGGREKTSRLNGFLSLKTPLISTKTLGYIKMVWRQLAQPTRLENLATTKLTQWITSHAEKLMHPISNPHDFDVANKAEDTLSEQIEIFKNYFKYTPGMMLSRLLTELMYQLAELLQKVLPPRGWEDVTKPFHQRHVTDRMLEIFFTTRLTSLSLNYLEMDTFGNALCPKSYMLTGLTHLNLDFQLEYPDEDNMESNIITFVKGLGSLTNFTIHSCTDNILKCVADNCKSIENITVHGYLRIRNDTFDLLAQLPKLRRVDLYESEQAFYEDYIKLEARKKGILEHIASKELFQIKSYVNHDVSTMEQMKLAVEKYPIESLTFAGTTDEILQDYEAAVDNLKDLRDLTIDGYHFYKSQVKLLLEAVGGKIQKLQLCNIEAIDLNALKFLSLSCPHLQNVLLTGFNFSKEGAEDSVTLNIEFAPFRDLKSCNLFFGGEGGQDLLVHVISNSPSLESIIIGRSSLTLVELTEILDKNPLPCLKDLRIFNELPKSVLNRIIENCNSPEVIIYNDKSRTL